MVKYGVHEGRVDAFEVPGASVPLPIGRPNTTRGLEGPLSTARMTWLTTRAGRHVFTRVDEPVGGSAIGALVVVPSLGRETTVPFRRLRALAVRAADAGYVVLSPSLAGDGESEDAPPEADLVEEWAAEVEAALAAAAAAVPGRPVNVVGWRLGAALAHRHEQAARSGAAVTPVSGAVILWEPVAGSSFLRQHQNLRRFASPVALAADGVELCGTFLTRAHAASVQALTVPRREPEGASFRIVRERDPKAVLQLTLGSPHFVEVALAGTDEMVAGLTSGEFAPYVPVPEHLDASWRDEQGRLVVETLVEVGAHRLPGVLTRSPEMPAQRGVLYTAIGSELRAGPGGTWTRSARELAPEGVVGLRMDRRTLGEDTDVTQPAEPYPYTEASVEDVRAGADYLRSHALEGVFGVGACSGAWSILRGAEDDRFTAVIAVNPVHWDPDPDHYDEAFYERTYRSEGAFAQVLESAGAEPAAEGEDAPHTGWRLRVDPYLHRLARKYPRLRGFLRGDRATDRVAYLLEPVASSATVALAMGPGEEAVFRAKGGPVFLAATDHRDRFRVEVDEGIDHSLFSLRSRETVRTLTRELVLGTT